MNEQHQREEALFDAALQLPAAERGDFLNKACSDDPQLRQRVESLLQAHAQTSGVLEHIPENKTQPPSAQPSEKPGDLIGRYKLLEQIGEGGCGVVYLAEQEEPVRRKVAFKIIKLGMDTRQVILRFEAERQALALMDHPNIAKVLDAGATENGRPYFVMELVRGIKITDYCDENNFSARRRLDLFMQVCHAVQHAHQKGIIHRDLKPSNILVTLHDGEPRPVVIDFGIAKATGGLRLTDQTVFTALEQFLGTPAYMSPEQAQLTSQDIDTRSDIYSLGVLLYELLTSKTPFDTKELLQAGLDEMLRTIREKEPARPSTRLSTMRKDELTSTARHRRTEAPKLVRLLSGDLDWIAMKCLEKNRTRRYETANGLAMDLERYLRQEPVLARRPSGAYRFQKLVHRHKLAFTAITAVVLSLFIGLGTATWQYFKQRQAHERADIEAKKSRKVADFLEYMLEGVGPSASQGRDTALLRDIMDRTLALAATELTNQPEVEAEMYYTIGKVYWELGKYEKAEELQRRSVSVYTKALGREDVHLARPLADLGLTLQWQGRLAEAESAQRQALELRRKSYGNQDIWVATSLGDLSIVLYAEDKLIESESLQREALEMRRKLLGNTHLDVALSLHNLAALLVKEGRFAEAETLQRECLEIHHRLPDDDPRRLGDALHMFASALFSQGKLIEAESAQRNCLAIFHKLLGDEHPDMATCLNNLGAEVRTQGNLDEAETIDRQALQIRTNAFGPENMMVAISLTELARVLTVKGELSDAEAIHRQALEIRRKLAGVESTATAVSLEFLARLLLDEGRAADAEPLARECLSIRQKKLLDDWLTFNAQCLLGEVLFALNKNPEAESALLAGYAGMTQREALIPHSGYLRREDAIESLARFYQATDQPGKAAEWQRKLAETTNQRFLKTAEQLRKAAQDDKPANLNAAAWLLATSPNPDVRDGSPAVAFAESAVAKTGRTNAVFLATLAAAYTETGQFDKAISTQKEAAAIASDEKTRSDFGTRLKMYENHTPFRDYGSLGFQYVDQGMFLDAEAANREELAYLQHHCPNSPAVWSNSAGRLAQILKMEHKFAEAEELIKTQAYQIR